MAKGRKRTDETNRGTGDANTNVHRAEFILRVIRRGDAFLNEPYVKHLPGYQQLARENFPAHAEEMASAFIDRPEWADELAKNTMNGELVVPPGEYFMMGDNRDDSNDSRYWGFTSRASIIGRPVIIYMSIDEPEAAWDSGHMSDRFEAYGEAAIHPGDVRWRRLFHLF